MIAPLAAVDRMTQGPRVDALMVVDKATITGALFAGSTQVRQSI